MTVLSNGPPVRTLLPTWVVIIHTWTNICRAPMKYTITTKNVVGASSGPVTFVNLRHPLAPSISAAS